MMDDWLLEHLAKVSTLSCVLIVLYFLVYSIWRITQMPNYPWNWNDWQWPLGGRHAVEIQRKPTQMPFTLTMIDRSKEDIGKCSFSVQYLKDRAPPQVTAIWGPSVTYAMKLINSSWNELRNELMFEELHKGEWNCLLDSSFTSSDDITTLNYIMLHRFPFQHERPGEDETIHRVADPDTEAEASSNSSIESHLTAELTISPPIDLDWNILKNQYRYPLAIFLTESENENSDVTSTDLSIHGVIQVIHVKSDTFPKASNTLAQYIKMSNGESHFLQPLYVIDDHRLDEDDQDAPTDAGSTDLPSEEPFSDILCSVCQVTPVALVIIPCRHVCLCRQCFEKVESCPICRGPILYYFRTRKDVETFDAAPTTPEELTVWQRIERWNDRFSAAMGLIRQY